MLREYQTAAIRRATASQEWGCPVVALVAPTGAGKTMMGAAWASRQTGSGCWVAHRQELLFQARNELGGATWCPKFISIQSVSVLPAADWYVLDECHHYYGAPEWTMRCKPARRGPTLALTATPERADGTGMGNLCDAIIVAAQPKELIKDGWLVPSDVIAGKQPTRALTMHPVEAWQVHAHGRKTIVFCRDVKHARDMADAFRDAGIPAGCIDGALDSDLRAARLAAHRSGELKVLTTVQVLTEGYDDPSVSCAIMARGFSSAGAWIQACGRVVRPYSGKSHAIIIDLRGSVYLWGLPDEDRSYSLEGRAMRLGSDDNGEAIRQCRVCQRVFRASEYEDAKCPACGVATKGKPDPAIRREQIGRVLATHTVEDKRRKYAELGAVARAKGYSHKWCLIQFKLRYGHWPGKDMR